METPNRSSRKLAAIMFTDIVGYTALMGSDREQAMILVRTNRRIHQELIDKHGGDLLKEMGDGSLSSFETALDAVNCAIEIQREAHQSNGIPLRIGIHLGDITLEDGEVYGDGVNVASRLESLASPGGILISESIEQAIRGQTSIKTAFAGKHQLKNVQYTVRTYAIQGEGLPKVVKRSQRRRFIPLLVLGLLAMLAFVVYKWSGTANTKLVAWEGEWDVYYYYETDSSQQFTGVMKCITEDSLQVDFTVRLPQSSRMRQVQTTIQSASRHLLTGEITYDIRIGGGKLKEYFEIRKDNNGQLSGSGRCVEYCAEYTDQSAIVWGGQKRKTQ